MNTNAQISSRGFTLIEVLLAAFIFTVTVGAVTVVFTSSSNMQTKNQVIRETNQSVQYAIETISRDVKAAKSTYYSVSDVQNDPTKTINGIKQPGFVISTDGGELTVNTQDGDKTYSLSSDGVLYVDSNPITNINEVKITSLTFEGKAPVDGLRMQPYVTIKISVESAQNQGGRTAEKATQELETTITSNYYPYAFTQ